MSVVHLKKWSTSNSQALCMIVVVVWLLHSPVLNLSHRGGGISVTEHLFCFFQITVMNGCCAVFATLSTVLCDPGGE